MDQFAGKVENPAKSGGELRLAEMTPGFCHYLRFINEAPLLEVPDKQKMHHYTRVEGEMAAGVFKECSTDETGRFHTFTIRENLRWSDGMPVTTEDVRYAVCDVLLHPKLRKYLTNSENSEIMMPEWEWINWGDHPVILYILDERRFTLEFSVPCFGFSKMQVRSARWQMLIKPFHYLKQFHERYAEKQELAARMAGDGFEGKEWDAFYHFIDPPIREAGYFVPERIPRIWDYPSLDPWIYEKETTKEHYVLKRNPYFYLTDKNGEKLPYFKRITRDYYPSKEEMDAALIEGKYDLSGCFLKCNDELLRNEEILKNFRKVLLVPWQVQQVVFLINLCPAQEWLRPYVQDVRFRRALSLSLDRKKMRDEIFGGDGVPSQIAPAVNRPYYQEKFTVHNREYDPDLAGKLLDEMGICFKEGDKRCRYFPDGREARLELVYYMVTPMADEAAEFLEKSLQAIGIRLDVVKLQNGSLMGDFQVRNRHIFSVWEMPGDDPFIPYQIGGLSDPCPLYWRWYETKGKEGIEPILPVKELYRLRDQMKMAKTQEESNQLAEAIYELQSQNLFVLGTVAGVKQPFLVRKGIQTGLQDGSDTLYSALSGVKTWYREHSGECPGAED